MLSDTDKKIIHGLPLFQGLPADVLEDLLDQAVPREYPKGHVLFHRDDPADRFYILLEGWVKVFRDTIAGDEAVLGVFTSGETLAEAAAFLDHGYPASAQVVEDARLVPVFSSVIRREIHSNPDIAMNMLASMSRHMHHFVVEVEQLKTCSATQRVIDFLLRRCAADEGPAVIFLPYDKTLISRRLGMQPESLSRILSKLRKLGVRTEQNRVIINDVGTLLDYCQTERANGQMVSNG
ncbi:MAG: Crp/Fnr family transcriptional regulator [Rhodospirillaceae bacterium]|nr:Crp/Fnr family transcriptional regulator [Rhodospirillaceae bacterium]